MTNYLNVIIIRATIRNWNCDPIRIFKIFFYFNKKIFTLKKYFLKIKAT